MCYTFNPQKGKVSKVKTPTVKYVPKPTKRMKEKLKKLLEEFENIEAQKVFVKRKVETVKL